MVFSTDALIIGSGVAGLTAAINLANSGWKVAICTKSTLCEAATYYAQGGVSAVPLKEDGSPIDGDSFEDHINDTLKAGAGLCKQEIVDIMVKNAYNEVILPMIREGVPFTPNHNAQQNFPYSLHQEGGHSAARIFHVADYTGRSIMESLSKSVSNNPNITIYENHMAIDLITNSKLDSYYTCPVGESGDLQTRFSLHPDLNRTDSESCVGAYVLDIKTNTVKSFSSSVTILATGGAGRVYLYTSNPDIATGDGMAMYLRLGHPLRNMEFMQFHPTCFYNPNPKNPNQRRFLVTEALRGKKVGGRLQLGRDDRDDFVKTMGYDTVHGSSSTRDVVARAIDTEMKKRGLRHVYLNVTPEVTKLTAEELKEGYPDIYGHCLAAGVDMTKEPIPVVPACHYTCGGIPVDLNGATNVYRLFAIGETTCSGLHGANRLASNSLLEAALHGSLVAKHITTELSPDKHTVEGIPEWQSGTAIRSKDQVLVAHHWDEVRQLMWNLVGIARTEERLLMAKRRIDMIREEIRKYYWHYIVTLDFLELRNITAVAESIIASALVRKETRGGHCRLDSEVTISQPIVGGQEVVQGCGKD